VEQSYEWRFPLPRTHTGVLQGNGTLGAMIWGEGRTLRITLGRADLWDHRGGMPWTERMTYRRIRECLERGDEPRLRRLFEQPAAGPGEPARPSIIPVGRVELDLGRDAQLTRATLALADGTVTVRFARGGRTFRLRVALDIAAPCMCVELPEDVRPRVSAVPAWRHVGEHLHAISFAQPRRFAGGGVSGWVQELPADPAVCVAWRSEGRELHLAVVRGQDARAARENARRRLACAVTEGFRRLRTRNAAWWRRFWNAAARVQVPNARLSFLYDYGMYKFATFTNPQGVPATLQGPWIEEYQMPPWSSDYHFNVNVQMCYSPAYHGNRLEHLLPLFEMIESWTGTLRHNARAFLGIGDGLMLPHAVDDRCTCMGGFWTGTVDPGSTAWVALMMYRYWRYSMDREFLRTRAYPFMVGTMRVYEELLERDAGGGFVLPVSVSPEYRGAQIDAWGRNASYQLACIHALCEALLAAAEALDEKPKTIWRDVLRRLPKASLTGDRGREMIALWDGMPLEESHRHHSHLAGIVPFDIFDLDAEPWQGILERSLAHWILRGPALWSGWSFPWAAAIHARFGNAEAAQLMLEAFDAIYTNEGHGTLHDCHAPGLSLMGIGATRRRRERPEIMQMDGGMGAVSAVQEMLLHTRRGVNYLFAGAPARWREAAFSRMRTDGAFLVSAERHDGEVTAVKVECPAGGEFRLRNPWGEAPARVRRGRRTQRLGGPVLTVPTAPGEEVVIERAPQRSGRA